MKAIKRAVAKCVQGYFERNNYIQGHINRNDGYGSLIRAWGYVVSSMMVGDYYEFGTYKGDSLVNSINIHFIFKEWLKNQLVSEEPWRREVFKDYVFEPTFCGYDTFEGMPSNDEGHVVWNEGTFLGEYEKVRQRCVSTGISEGQLHLVKNDFKNLEQGDMRGKASIINLDSDLYRSAVDALELVKDKIQQGTVLLADDYHAFCASNEKGERLAMREFTEKYGVTFEPWFAYKFNGQAFFCHV